MAGGDQFAELDIIVAAPGGADVLDGLSSGMRSTGDAAVQGASGVDKLSDALTQNSRQLAENRAEYEASGAAMQRLDAIRSQSVQAMMAARQIVENQIDGMRDKALADLRIIEDAVKNGFIKPAEARAIGENVGKQLADGIDSALRNSQGTGFGTRGATDWATQMRSSVDGVVIDQTRFVRSAAEVQAAMAATNAVTAESSTAFNTSGLQLGRLTQGLTTWISSMLGGIPVVGRMVATVGRMAVGTAEMVGILAGVAAIAYAYEKITEKSREAQKAAEEFAKTEQARQAQSTAMGVVQSTTGIPSSALGMDIPALSEQAKKAQEAMAALDKQLSELPRTFDTFNQLIAGMRTGQVSASDFSNALRQVAATPGLGQFYAFQIEQLGQIGSLYLANKEALNGYNAAILQTTAIQQFYKNDLQATSESEGKLLEQIQQRQRVLSAYQSGGPVAGKNAEGELAAQKQAATLYEEEARSGREAALATVTYQQAIKQKDGAAHDFAERYLADAQRLIAVDKQIADSQKQQASGTADTNRFTALADSINRLEQESQSFGKDGSIDTRIAGMDDQLTHFVTTMAEQVTTGKISQASFESQAAAVEDLRQKLQAAGVDLKQAFSDQVTKQITDQNVASKQLFDALVDGTGAYHDLSAAKQAQLEIDRLAKQLGHDLSEVDQQQIRDQKERDTQLTDARAAAAMRERAAAAVAENAAIQSGASTRATYAADLVFQQAMAHAATMNAGALHDSYVRDAVDEHNKQVAVALTKQGITDLASEEKKAAEMSKQFHDETIRLASSIEKDLFSAIERFSSGGITSASAFFKEVSSLSLRVTEQLDSTIHKMSSTWADAFQAGDTALASSIDSTLRQYEGLRDAVGKIAAGITAAMAGYQIGQQSGSSFVGAIGGAAAGAAAGGQVAGPWGAVAGGLLGAAGGLLGASDAQQKAAEALQKAADAYAIQASAFIANATGDAVQQKLTAIDNQLDALLASLRGIVTDPNAYNQKAEEVGRAALQQKQQVVQDFWNSITQGLNQVSGAAGAFDAALFSINQQYQQNMQTATALGANEGQLQQIEALRTQQLWQLSQATRDSITSSLLQRAGVVADPFADLKQAIKDAVRNGLTDLSAALTQELGLDQAFSGWLDGLQAQAAATKLASDIASAHAALANAVLQDQLKTQQEALTVNAQQLQAQQQAVSNLKQTVDALQSTRDALKLNTGLTTLSPFQQLEEARRQFQDLAAKAMAGDQTAAAGLSAALQTELQASRTYNASGQGYDSDYTSGLATLAAVQDHFGTQLTVEQQILAEAQKQNDKLTQSIALLNAQLNVQQQTQTQAAVANLVALANQNPTSANQINGLLHQYGYGLNQLATLGANGMLNPTGSFFATSGFLTAAQAAAQNAAQQKPPGWFPGWTPDDPGWVPGFAAGGRHRGGLRVVGEHGPEIEYTAPSYITNANDTKTLLSGSAGVSDEMLTELKALRKEVAMLAAETALTRDVLNSRRS